tara:strand:- start:24 stop:623 length:600 start_codon:yes stop_codon:yes gene_type:complete
MPYLGTQPNNVKKNIGLYNPSEILQLTKDGSWGGSLELIQSQTVSTVANVAFTTIKESVYDVHLLQVFNYQPATNDRLGMRFYEGGVLETASVYEYAYQYGYYNGGFGENKSTGDNHLKICPDEVNGAGDSSEAYCYIYNAGDSSKYTFTTQQMVGTDFFRYGGGILPQASTVDGLYLYGDNNGENFSCTANLYGVKQI